MSIIFCILYTHNKYHKYNKYIYTPIKKGRHYYICITFPSIYASVALCNAHTGVLYMRVYIFTVKPCIAIICPFKALRLCLL